MFRQIAIALLIALPGPATAQRQPDCPPDIASDSPPCVPPGLASQAYQVGNTLGEEHPLASATETGLPELAEDEAYALVEGLVLVIETDTRIIKDVVDVVPDETDQTD